MAEEMQGDGVGAFEREPENAVEAFERALSGRSEQLHVLRLYITGMTPKSRRAVANIKALCEEHLRGRYDLEVIDIYQQPSLARREQIVVAPTLIKELPLPSRRLVGDLSDDEKVFHGLGLSRRR